MPASVLTRRRRVYGGMKRVMKRCRSVSRKPPSSSRAHQGSRSYNNLQFAHQLRVLTNYKDINGGGTAAARQPPGVSGPARLPATRYHAGRGI